MKRTFGVCLLLISTLTLGTLWAADPGDKKIGQDVQQLKKDYESKVHKDLKEIGAKIDKLKEGVEKGGKAGKAQLRQEVKKLHLKKVEADRKLAELGKSTGDAWKDLRKGLDKAVEDLKNSVDKANEQFKSGSKT